MWAEPEHGPPPYLQTLPHTKLRPSSCLELFTKGCAPADMADLWDVNARVARQMREQHAAAVQALALALIRTRTRTRTLTLTLTLIQGVGVRAPTSEPKSKSPGTTSQSRLERELQQLNLLRAAQQDEHISPLAKDPAIRPTKPPA